MHWATLNDTATTSSHLARSLARYQLTIVKLTALQWQHSPLFPELSAVPTEAPVGKAGMALPHHRLSGSCACERNQYTIYIPSTPDAQEQAQVFFDNSAANRRSQAAPLTAWLRIPLGWYRSHTFALFPDETHSSIRRTFHTPSQGAEGVTRRQFCGYCGSHLSAFDEGQSRAEGGAGREGDGTGRIEWMDITLGSLMDESLQLLGETGILRADSESDVEGSAFDGDEADDVAMSNAETVARRRSTQPPNAMRNRGMPYFESMVENSRLGRIKRQKGGHTSRDGRTSVSWEVVEIDGSEGAEGEQRSPNKRPRLEP